MTTLPGRPDVDDVAEPLQQARAASQTAFTEMVRRHHRIVRVYLARFVRDAEAVDDLAQEVFLAAYRGLADFHGHSTLQTWLLGIARFQALQYLRGESRRQRREARLLDEALEIWHQQRHEVTDHDPAEVEREFAALRACLEQLPPNSLQVVKEHYFEQRTAEEIAARLGKRSGAVRMLLLRIRRGLAACIQRRLAGEEGPP